MILLAVLTILLGSFTLILGPDNSKFRNIFWMFLSFLSFCGLIASILYRLNLLH